MHGIGGKANLPICREEVVGREDSAIALCSEILGETITRSS